MAESRAEIAQPSGQAARGGRPRSERARRAVLHAVDDLLAEQGYAAMTMKGIAERAGVGRQTVYRWWPTTAEILLEACVADAHEELATRPDPDAATDLLGFLAALEDFLVSPAGLAYRALVGKAQHDPAVRDLLHAANPLTGTAGSVLARHRSGLPAMPTDDLAITQLIGPLLYSVLTGPAPLTRAQTRAHVEGLLAAWGAAGQKCTNPDQTPLPGAGS